MSRVGIVCDIAGEEWPSMDLVAGELIAHLQAARSSFVPTELRAPTTWRLARVPLIGSQPPVRTLDRLINRYRDYPRWLETHRQGQDLFHIIDHSYAHLAAVLPDRPVVVTCHDLDAFRPVLQPGEEPRPRWFRALVARTLAGLRQATRVACVSAAVRDELASAGLVDVARARVVPNGVDDAMRATADTAADSRAERLLGAPRSADILHVGSAIQRKRIDVLLQAFARVHRAHPESRLVRVGSLTGPQRALAVTLGVHDALVELPFLERDVLAAVYRRARVVMMPSDREGFGLPVAEGLACGALVVASDIASLRETGGDAAVYARPGDDAAFADAALRLIDTAPEDRRARGIRHAARFTWAAHAASMEAIYREVDTV